MLAAAFRGDAISVKELLEDGAGINYPDGKWGTTPLMAAAAPTQRPEVLKVLLRRKDLDKDAVNKRGMTALHQAAWYGQKEAVYLLLTMGASEKPKTEDGHTAADIARMMGHTETSTIFAEAEEDRRKNSIESADALRDRLKSQSRQRSAKSLLALALPPPRPLYVPQPPSDPVEKPPPQKSAAAPEQEEDEERKRPQFEGAGGGGPSKKWGHEIGKEGGSGRQNKENEHKKMTNDGKAEANEEEESFKAAPASRVEMPRSKEGKGSAAPEIKGDKTNGAAAEKKATAAVVTVEMQQQQQQQPQQQQQQQQQQQLERSTPVLRAAEILDDQDAKSKTSAGTQRLGLGKRYEHADPRPADTRKTADAKSPAVPEASKPRAHSSMQLSSTSADSDLEGSFFLTQKPPSRPTSGAVRR